MFRGLLRSQENFIKNSLKKVYGSIIEFGQNQPKGHWDKSKDKKESYRRTNPVVKMDRKGCEITLFLMNLGLHKIGNFGKFWRFPRPTFSKKLGISGIFEIFLTDPHYKIGHFRFLSTIFFVKLGFFR